MTVQILMPALSPTMTEGKLSKWLVKEGDVISSGKVLAEIETDKATMELEAVDEGVLGKILVPAGTEKVQVNRPIAVLLAEGEKMSPTNGAQAPAAPASAAPVTPPQTPPPPAVAKPASPSPAPAAPAAAAPADEPQYSTWKTQSVREALRDAMAEEMRADGSVFLMGEEVGEYQGAYKISQGLLDEFG